MDAGVQESRFGSLTFPEKALEGFPKNKLKSSSGRARGFGVQSIGMTK